MLASAVVPWVVTGRADEYLSSFRIMVEKVQANLNGESKQGPELVVLRENTEEENTTAISGLQYQIDESPPLHIALFVAIQHLVICFASTLTLSIIIGDTLCTAPDSVLRSRLFNTALCLSGLNTIFQSVAGSRLPVFQGPSFTFIAPLIVLGSDPSWSCDSDTTHLSHLNGGQSDGGLSSGGGDRGAGLVGPIMRRVGPITVAPTIMLLGLSLYKLPIQYSRPCPLMALASAVLVVVFSLYLQRVEVPMGCGKNKSTLPVFKIFPVLLSICVVWVAAAILTVCGVFSDDPQSLSYLARTDAKVDLVRSTPWLLVTYPGQFGMPSFNIAAFVGFTAAVLSSVVESVGDYFTASRCCEVRPPPQHAVSRGLLMEGVGSVLNGAYGACHATASYSTNVALLSLCRTASRSVLVMSGVILVAVSFVGKIAAAFSTVPEPILGGVFLVMLSVLVSLGMSTVRYVDLQSTRNLIILGVAVFVGMVIPAWVEAYPDTIDTGSREADQVMRVALGTPMILGGVIACFLDNTSPGTRKERGMVDWGHDTSTRDKNSNRIDPEDATVSDAHAQQEPDVYGWTWYPAMLQKCRLLRYVPFLPPHSTYSPTHRN